MNELLNEYPDELSNMGLIVGLDETGRGCLAGPVVTGAVILPKGFNHKLIKDSKSLSKKQLAEAYKIITENAIVYSVKHSSVKTINNIGINKATFLAMYDCLNDILNKGFDIKHILVDGTVFDKFYDINHTTVIKGDNTYTCIAAGAILAKVERDNYMIKLHDMFPVYDFASNKGYGTKTHINTIKKHGIIQSHRELFVRNFI